MLQNVGVTSDSCLSGLEGLKQVKKRIKKSKEEHGPSMYSLILLDYSMPDIDGPQFAIKVRSILDE